MIRKSIIYRRLWYVRKRNTGRVHVILRLLAAMLILTSLFLLFTTGLLPWLRQIVELDIGETYKASLNEAADKVFSYGLEYKDIIVFESAADGSISALSLNTARLDDLTEELLYRVDKKLGFPDSGEVRVSLADPESPVFKPGGLLDFNMAIRQDVKPVIKYISEYIPVNNGQTKLRVTLAANAEISYKGSFLEGNAEISAEIPVAEFIILGKLPEK
jgi:hypothetical protein